MISVGCLIMCVNLLNFFDQAETCNPSKTRIVRKDGEELVSNSLTVKKLTQILYAKINPYWNVTYDEELHRKQNSCRSTLDSLVKSSRLWPIPIKYELLPIVPSPVTKGYRNRDEFFIGQGVDGNPKTVGYAIQSDIDGKFFSFRPTKIVTIKENHARVAQVYEDFIRLSPLPPYVQQNSSGHWRSLLIRSNELGNMMVFVGVQPRGFTNEKVHEQQLVLKQYFRKHLPNITLYHQQCVNRRCKEGIPPCTLLYGLPYIMETLNGYKFKITTQSFFPNNKLGAERLYRTAIKMAKLTPRTTVLDLCSYTGLISILLSKYVKQSISIEAMWGTTSYAKYNAYLNEVHNIKFEVGKLNYKLQPILRSLTSNDTVAIFHPRIIGLGFKIIQDLRNCPQISRVVYITSKFDKPHIYQNILSLCENRNSKIRTPPFKLSKAIAVDLLPQTPEVSLILTFHR